MSRVRSSIGRRFTSVYIPSLGGLAACFSLACGGDTEQDGELQRIQSDLTAQALAPTSGHSCEELLARFKSSLLAQVSTRAEEARTNPYGVNPLASDVVPVLRGAELPGGPPTAAPPSVAPPTPGRPPFSATTPRVPGLDPADLIKAEGDRLYVVHDRSLLVLNAADASDVYLIASVPLGNGSPTDLLVHEGRVVVFSTLYDGLPGTARPLDPYLYPTYFAQLTLVDATGAAPVITGESYFEGGYSFAERSGSIVRAFLTQTTGVGLDYPPVSYTDIFGRPRSQEDIDRQIDLWVELTTATIEESTVDDYLPERYERVNGELRSVPVACSELVVPALGQDLLGGSALVSLDLAAPAASPSSISLFGYAAGATIAANTVVLAKQDYGPQNLSPLPQSPPEVRVILHAFELDGVTASYASSASVPGYLNGALGVNEASGVISGVFTQDVYSTDDNGQLVYERTNSKLQTLQLDQGTLTPLGESASLPGDYVQASRIEGDRAYLVSYAGNVNRLSVADLSDPSDPGVTGGVDLAGSPYVLTPLGEDRLLGVAQTYDPATFASRLQLQVLDVQDSANPELAAQLEFGQDSYSEALYDPRAISVDADGAHFALPVESYGTTSGAASSSLDVFELTENGLMRLGGVVHDRGEPTQQECLALLGYPTDAEFVATLPPELLASLLLECGYYQTGTARRGLFRGDELFALSTAALTAHTLDALSGPPLSQIDLPFPQPFPLPPTPVIDVVPAPAEE